MGKAKVQISVLRRNLEVEVESEISGGKAFQWSGTAAKKQEDKWGIVTGSGHGVV